MMGQTVAWLGSTWLMCANPWLQESKAKENKAPKPQKTNKSEVDPCNVTMCSMNIKDSNYICKADYIAIIKTLEHYQ